MKKIRKFDWRVEVWPKGLGNFGCISISDYAIEPDEEKRNERYRMLCEEIKEQIERHVDNVGSVYVICDTEEVCEFCGLGWEEADGLDPDEPKGIPLCCNKAQEEWKKNSKGELK